MQTENNEPKRRRVRRPTTIDPRLAEVIVGLNLNALLPGSMKQALKRLRTKGADREAVLATALASLLPWDVLPTLLSANGVDVKGDWRGIYIGVDSSLRLLDDLATKLNVAEDRVGLAIVWRLALFELAVRIGAAAFAADPSREPVLRHDLWATDDGFKLFLRQLLHEHGLTLKRLGDLMIERRLASFNVEKGQFERWLYEGRTPRAENIHLFCRGIAATVGGSEAQDVVTALRIRVHLFLGCRGAYEVVSGLVGDEKARGLAAAFAKQVHASFRTLRRLSETEHNGPLGPIPMDAWREERRRLARKAAFFGIRPGGMGSHLLYETKDQDLACLSWPATSPFLFEPDATSVALFERFEPGSTSGAKALVALVRGLPLDDVLSDASEGNPDRQPLGFVGLVERVLKRRLPI